MGGDIAGRFQPADDLIEFRERLAFLDGYGIFVAPICVSLRAGFQMGPASSFYFSWRSSRLSQRPFATSDASFGKHSTCPGILLFVPIHLAGVMATFLFCSLP